MNSNVHWLDFNDASPQRNGAATTANPALNKEEVKQRLIDRIGEVLAFLLPAGKVRSGKFYVGDVQGNSGDSMEVEMSGPKAGLWCDHATDESGDILDLWAAVHGMNARANFPRLMADIRSWLGEMSSVPATREAAKPQPPMDDLGLHTGKWDYHDADGKLIACVYRYDPPGRRKQFRPLDVLKRKWQAPEPRPLYNQPGIKNASEVILVEGEKAAQALIDSGLCATTAMHGANAPVEKTDWSPISGKHVLIWPDKDVAGWDYAIAAAQAITHAGAVRVVILEPPGDKPEKWDAADAVTEGMNIPGFLAVVTRQEYPVIPTLQTSAMLPAFRMGDLLDDHSPMPIDIIGNRLLTPAGILVIGGAPKVGKSDFLISLLAFLSAGVPFLDFESPRPLRVFYLQAEIQYHYLRERLQKLRFPAEVVASARSNLVVTPKVRMLLDANGVEQTVATVRHFFPNVPPDILCIDPIRNLFDGGPDGGGENDNNAMLFFLRERVEQLRETVNPNAGVILSHHTKKITKKQLMEDPFQALSGAGSLRGYYSAGILMHRPEESQSERKLHFELRNGPAIADKRIDKVDGQWVELDLNGERLVQQTMGEKLDAERDRKQDVIIQLILDEAADGRVYTPAQFAEKFENHAGLGGRDNIVKRISVAATKSEIKFFHNFAEHDLPPAPRSKFGYMCAEGMVLRGSKNQLDAVLPTHFKCQQSGAVLPVENPEVWVYQGGEKSGEE